MNINRFISQIDGMSRTNKFEVQLHGPSGLRSRGIRCTSVSIPPRTVGMIQHRYSSAGPVSNYANEVDYGGTVDLTFVLDHTYEDRQMVEFWQSNVYDEAYNLNYPEQYHGEIVIKQLGLDGIPTYEVKLWQCFPTTVGPITFDAGNGDIQTFVASFAFRSWTSSFENAPSGLLGGLFKKYTRKLSSKLNKKLSDKLFG